jgi:sulfotransferase famil protein
MTDLLSAATPVVPAAPAAPFSRHVLQRTVVLPELRVLFLPVPKAGCTSVLWVLARLAGIPLESFAQSAMPEVSPALTVHDMSVWRPEHRLAEYEGAERERVLTEDGWFRFSIVRHPGTRLWSAWQSKLLLREPRFVEEFGDAPWFPRLPERPEQILDDFRRFVAALPDGGAEDVHWTVQHELVRQLPLTHVGRVERLEETLAALRAHVPAELWPSESGRENRSPLPMPPHAYDSASATALQERYRQDFRHYGYGAALLDGVASASGWDQQVEPLLPVLRASIEEHARVGQLHRLAQQRGRRIRTVEDKLATVGARQVGPANAPVLANREGLADFNVRWAWLDGPVEPGFTAVVRVKNEARSLPWVLPALLGAVRRVVLVDNGSTDGSAAVAQRAAAAAGLADRLEVHSYPFAIARCGDEHLGTPTDSVHSLAYFYNWCFSHVRTGYALKWDGDMVLTDTLAGALRDLAWQLEASEVVVKAPRYPLYVVDDRRAFVDVGLRNCEAWGWPNRPGYSFVKALEWELPLWRDDIATVSLPDWSCVELKHLDADEFAHWSHTDFDRSERTRRKRREWEVFHALVAGGDPPAGVIPVVAPEGEHVIEHIRSDWLADKAREPAPLGARIVRAAERIAA